MSRRILLVIALLVPASLYLASPAAACGGLVGENGTIQLVRTTTLAAYHDGVERYVTNFEFSGEGEEVGTIVPLPDVPTDVERGGDWTLQRLAQEVVVADSGDALAASAEFDTRAGAEVLLETQIDALDITVLRGGGDEVGEWALDNGFFLTPDAPDTLDFYAERSPVFMAARFDASRAAELGQTTGDGTPIMVTVPTDQPWVPLNILALGADDDDTIEADVFLLTDDQPELLTGGAGVSVVRDEQASDLLLDDLRSDVGMEWVPAEMWLSYLQVDATAGDLDYDLAISADDTVEPSVVDAGLVAPSDHPDGSSSAARRSVADGMLENGGGWTWWPLVIALGAGAGMFLLLSGLGRPEAGSRTGRKTEELA